MVDRATSIEATYQGYPLHEFRVRRTEGLRPDKIAITFAWSANIQLLPLNSTIRQRFITTPAGPIKIEIGWISLAPVGSLVLKDKITGNTITIDRLYVDVDGLRKLPRTGLIELTLVDKRWMWQKRGYVTSDRNMVVTDPLVPWTAINQTTKSIVTKETTKQKVFYDSRTIKGKRLWTLYELMAVCVNAFDSGINDTPVPFTFTRRAARIADNIRPNNVDWGAGRLAAEALQQLLEEYGFTVFLLLDNSLIFGHVEEPFDFDVLPEETSLSMLEEGETYQFDAPAFCVTGDRIRREILLTDWEYVIKDLETGEYEHQSLIFKKYNVNELWASQQVLLSDKGKQFAGHDFNRGGDETFIEELRNMFADQAFKVVRLPSKYQKYLPLLALKGMANPNRPSKPGEREIPISISAFMFRPEERSARPQKSLWINGWHTDTDRALVSIDTRKGILTFKQPVGIFKELEVEDFPAVYDAKDIEKLWGAWPDNKLPSDERGSKVALKQKDKERRKAEIAQLKKEIDAAGKLLNRYIEKFAQLTKKEERLAPAIAVFDIQAARDYFRRHHEIIGKNQVTLIEEITSYYAKIKELEKACSDRETKNIERAFMWKMGPIIVHASFEYRFNRFGDYYRYFAALPGYNKSYAQLLRNDNLQLYYPLPYGREEGAVFVSSNVDELDRLAAEMVAKHLQHPDTFNSNVETYASFHTVQAVNYSAGLKEIELTHENESAVTIFHINHISEYHKMKKLVGRLGFLPFPHTEARMPAYGPRAPR